MQIALTDDTGVVEVGGESVALRRLAQAGIVVRRPTRVVFVEPYPADHGGAEETSDRAYHTDPEVHLVASFPGRDRLVKDDS